MATTTQSRSAQNYHGDDKALAGLVLGVLTFWLFAQTTLNVGPAIADDLQLSPETLNIAIASSAMVSGMVIVAAGNIADRVGHVRSALVGNIIGVVGALIVAFAVPAAGALLFIAGRVLQGLSVGIIMPSTLALVKTYWHGEQRQRAVSMWSIGTFGGSSLAALFGGFMLTTPFGWRSIFVASAIVSVLSILLMRGIPEDAPEVKDSSHLDFPGMITLAVAVLATLIAVTQGGRIGWANPVMWILIAVALVSLFIFIYAETHSPAPLVRFGLFRNHTFTGAVIANFLINATAGLIPVTMWLLQGAGGISATRAGLYTIGFAVCVIGFIRVGEKMLQKYGPRLPMVMATLFIIVALGLLMMTNTLVETYIVFVVIAFSLFGLGLAFFATPATDAALTSLPQGQAGTGAGVFKMASSLGSAFGVAIPTAIFTSMQTNALIVSNLIVFTGRQDNVAIREAGMGALASVMIMAVTALVVIFLFIPKKSKDPLPES